jgi:transposase-like protein
MPLRYSNEFRLKAVERKLAGERIKDLAVELGVANPTLDKWRRQALTRPPEIARSSRAMRPTAWPSHAEGSRTSKTS